MRKFIKSILSLSLAAAFVFSVVSCKNNEDNGTEAPFTGKYLVKDGVSEYDIVIPADADQNEQDAASELQLFIKEATGATLDIVRDSTVVYSETAQYLSVGDTTLFDAAGLSVSTVLGKQGFIVKTQGESIYMCGGSSEGSLYAAYELLTQLFDFDVFGPGAVYYEKKSSQELLNLHIEDKPAIEMRLNGYGFFSKNAKVKMDAKRLRINSEGLLGVGNSYVYNTHNSMRYFTEKQLENNPEFKATSGTQLCYLARGNEEKLALMKTIILDVMKDAFSNNPNKDSIAFMQEDHNDWCECDACGSYIEAHGGYHAATQIKLVNELARELKIWNDAVCPERDLRIVVFAYHKTTDAPVIKTESGEYMPYSEDMIMESNTAVYYAPITADYYYSFKHDNNMTFYNILKGWNTLCPNLYMWMYSTNFFNYLYFFDCYGTFAENYQIIYEHGGQMIFENTQYNNTNSTAFHVLKAYLNAKLMWDPYQDYNALIERWFNGYFGVAAKPMREMFDSMRMQTAKQITEDGFTGGLYEETNRASLWPFAMVNQWLTLIDDAQKIIDSLRDTNNEMYEQLNDRILLESLCPRYMLIELYAGRFDDATLRQMKIAFKVDATRLQVSNQSEAGKLSTTYNAWGV